MPTKNELPPPVEIGTNRCAPDEALSDHAATGTRAAAARIAPRRGPRTSASAGTSRSRFARVRIAAASRSPASGNAFGWRRAAASATKAAVSQRAPSGSDSRSPVTAINGG